MGEIDNDDERQREATAALERERALLTQLRREREARRLTQAEVSERIGARHQTISQREKMTHRATLQDFIVWARAMGLELDVQLRPEADLGEQYPEAVALLPLVWDRTDSESGRLVVHPAHPGRVTQ